jgi:DNA primase
MAAGSQRKGLCPFHSEKTPSFFVNPGRGVYHCFGCKAGGDAIDLVQKTRHVDFIEAMYVMGSEAGVDLDRYERPLTAEEKAKEALRSKVEAWIESLPADPSSRSDGAPDSMMPRLVSERPNWLGNLKEYHFEGVLFPMRTPQGKICGWRIRTADKKMFATPKDFQLTERTLYGIDQARQAIREIGEVILVEGEYDCIAMHLAGFRNTVAIGGSNLNDEQMEIIQELKIPRAVVALDGDSGGKTGSRSIAERWWKGDVKVFIADLPEDEDPDDIVRGSGGHTDMLLTLGRARWALEWILRDEWSERGTGMSDKLEYLEWIQENFGGSMTPTEETIVSQHVAKWLQMPESQVLDFGRINSSKLQATDSEQIVIAKCMRSKEYYRMLRKKLQMSDFFMVRHQRLWRVLEELLAEDLDFELVAMRQRAELATVDADYVDQLLQTPETNLAYHEDQIRDLALRRFAREAADRFREQVADTSQDAVTIISALTDGVTRRTLNNSRLRTTAEIADAAMGTIHERMRNPNAIHGFDVGSQFPRLMQRIQGFQKKRFALVAATSGVGKTTIAFQWAVSYAVHGLIPTEFVSLEMDEEELLFKAAAHLTGIEAEKITGGSLDESEANLVEQALNRVAKSPLHLYAPSDITPSEFVLYCRESKLEYHTEIFMLDYAQLVSPEPGSEGKKTYEQLKEFGRIVKMQVAMGMDACVICPAQLTRMSADKEKPTKEDMGDSYDLSRTADVVCILKGNEESSTIDFWVDKNRQGPPGILIPMEFENNLQTFHEHGAPSAPDYRLGALG